MLAQLGDSTNIYIYKKTVKKNVHVHFGNNYTHFKLLLFLVITKVNLLGVLNFDLGRINSRLKIQ